MKARHLYAVPRRVTPMRGSIDWPVVAFYGGLAGLYLIVAAVISWGRS